MLSACRSERPVEEIAAAHGVTPAELARDLPDDALLAGIARVERIFVRDATPLDPDQRVAIEARGVVETLWPLEAGNCYTLAAWGEPAELDFDLRLEEPGGRVMAFEDAPDNFPLIPRFCAERSGRHALRVSVRGDGGGEALVRVWRQLPGVTRSVEAQIEALAAEYLGEGFAAEAAVQTTALREGRSLEFPLLVVPGRCYGVVGTSTDVTDLDLVLTRDGDDEPLMRDLGTDATPVLLPYCPEQTGVVRLRVHAYAGQGRVWWQVWAR